MIALPYLQEYFADKLLKNDWRPCSLNLSWFSKQYQRPLWSYFSQSCKEVYPDCVDGWIFTKARSVSHSSQPFSEYHIVQRPF